METREFWLLVSFLIIALGALASLVVTAVYIPLKKIPNTLKVVASTFYQKLYVILIFSLFSTLVGLGVYVPLQYDQLINKDIAEIVRGVLFLMHTVLLFVITLSFKKQTLSTPKIVTSSLILTIVLVIATQENTLDFYNYLYILPILALFAIVRYGIRTFIKKF